MTNSSLRSGNQPLIRGEVGALGFHPSRFWLILVLGFHVLGLNLAVFRVLRCVMGCEFSQFLCSCFGHFIQNFLFVGFSCWLVFLHIEITNILKYKSCLFEFHR